LNVILRSKATKNLVATGPAEILRFAQNDTGLVSIRTPHPSPPSSPYMRFRQQVFFSLPCGLDQIKSYVERKLGCKGFRRKRKKILDIKYHNVVPILQISIRREVMLWKWTCKTPPTCVAARQNWISSCGNGEGKEGRILGACDLTRHSCLVIPQALQRAFSLHQTFLPPFP
jgi:hypothetical protein